MESSTLDRATNRFLQPRFLIAWVVLVALVRFVNLGFLDLQAWDEGLYALRSKSIVQFGDWLDQTQHVPGGLTTSCYPPLTFWTTAAFYKLLGPNEWTSRFTSALFGAASVWLIVLIARNVEAKATASIVGILFGTNLFYTFFTRQGQLDVAYVFFLLLSTYGWLEWNKGERRAVRRRGLLYIAVGTWGAFMSKILVGFYVPLILLLAQGIEMRHRWRWRSMVELCAAVGLGILIALPWHVFMFMKHGSAFLDAFLGLHLLQRLSSPIEGHNPSLGIFFYVNQLFVHYPESALGIGLFAFLLQKKSRGTLLVSHTASISVAWSVVVFSLITFMATKIPQYMIPLSVPVALLGGVALGLLVDGKLGKGRSFALIVLLSVTTAWSALWPVRAYIKNAVLGLAGVNPYVELSGVIVSIVLVSSGYAIYLSFHRPPTAVERTSRSFAVVLLILVTLRVVLEITVNDQTKHDVGTKTVAHIIREQGAERVVYVGKDLNPALDLYLKGWGSWQENIHLDYYLSEPTALAPSTSMVDPPLPGKVTCLVEETRIADQDYFVNLQSLKVHSSLLFRNSTYRVSILSSPK